MLIIIILGTNNFGFRILILVNLKKKAKKTNFKIKIFSPLTIKNAVETPFFLGKVKFLGSMGSQKGAEIAFFVRWHF